jgi:hypothetical protein
MGKGFEIEFNGDWERDLCRMAQGQVDQLAKDGTRATERVLASHGGQPIDVVKLVLQRDLKRAGLDVTDPLLTQCAQQISDGGHFTFEPGQIK